MVTAGLVGRAGASRYKWRSANGVNNEHQRHTFCVVRQHMWRLQRSPIRIHFLFWLRNRSRKKGDAVCNTVAMRKISRAQGSQDHRRLMKASFCRVGLVVTAVLFEPAWCLTLQSPLGRAVHTWVEKLVIGRKLCPWATTAESRGFRLRELHDADEAMAVIVDEAAGLAARASSAEVHALPTTLIVCDDPQLDDLGEFATYCRRAVRRIQRVTADDERVALLGFHPQRVDSGPGCSSNPEDPGHYAVRSPLPLVQVLREADLTTAREQWRERHASEEPGALGLLLQNKVNLRRLGAEELRRILASCSPVV